LSHRCGAGAASTSCGDHNSAFWDECGDAEPKHNCTRDDVEITGMLCACAPPMCDESYGVAVPPANQQEATCFYEMPALIYGDSTTTNHLRDSLKQRIAIQGDDSELTSTWNEIVIDDRLLIPKIRTDPTEAIWAFVCRPTEGIPDACVLAKAMRDEFLIAYNVTGSIPVLLLDTESDFTVTGGPFALPPNEIFA